MRDLSPFNFGLIIAYLVPGFVILWGLSFHSPTVAAWLAGPPDAAPAIGDLFYATLASVACGMFANFLRWAVIDTIHHRTGLRRPRWDFSRLQERLGAYELLVELHYKHYQYAANMCVSLVFAYIVSRPSFSGWLTDFGLTDVGFLAVCVVLFFGSRDALRKYYARAGALLTPSERG